MDTETPADPAERARVLAGLGQAARRHQRSATTLDAWLLKARAAGATYVELSNATGWDRRTVSRYLARLATELAEQGYVVTVHEGGLTIEQPNTSKGTHHGNA